MSLLGTHFQRGGWTSDGDRGEDGAKFKLEETLASEALLQGRVIGGSAR